MDVVQLSENSFLYTISPPSINWQTQHTPEISFKFSVLPSNFDDRLIVNGTLLFHTHPDGRASFKWPAIRKFTGTEPSRPVDESPYLIARLLLAAHEADRAPDPEIERVARALVVVDGLNPDADRRDTGGNIG